MYVAAWLIQNTTHVTKNNNDFNDAKQAINKIKILIYKPVIRYILLVHTTTIRICKEHCRKHSLGYGMIATGNYNSIASKPFFLFANN